MTNTEQFVTNVLSNLVDLTWSNDLQDDGFPQMIRNIDEEEVEYETGMSKAEVLNLFFSLGLGIPSKTNEVLKELNQYEEDNVNNRDSSFLGRKEDFFQWLSQRFESL